MKLFFSLGHLFVISLAFWAYVAGQHFGVSLFDAFLLYGTLVACLRIAELERAIKKG